MIWHAAVQQSGELQAKLAAIEAEANRKRSEAAKARPRNKDGTLASGGPDRPATGDHTAREAMAEASRTNASSVKRMLALETARPDLAEAVRLGEQKPTAALRIMKKDQVAEIMGMTQKNVSLILEGIGDFRFILNPGDFAGIEDDDERLDAAEDANRANAEHEADFKAPI